MEYKERAKTRKLKRTLLGYIALLKFKSEHFSVGKKISAAGFLFIFLSLFFSWVDSSVNPEFQGNAFSYLTGSVGFFVLIFLCIIGFFLFSQSKKEKFKISFVHFSENVINISISLFLGILGIQTFQFISKGLVTLSSDIIIGKGIILYICACCILLFGTITLKRESRKNRGVTILSDSEPKNEEEKELEENMKLPF